MFSHGGQVGGVFGAVLQGGQLGHLLYLRLAGLGSGDDAQQGLQVVRQHLHQEGGTVTLLTIPGYNARVPGYNSRVPGYNA